MKVNVFCFKRRLKVGAIRFSTDNKYPEVIGFSLGAKLICLSRWFSCQSFPFEWWGTPVLVGNVLKIYGRTVNLFPFNILAKILIFPPLLTLFL